MGRVDDELRKSRSDLLLEMIKQRRAAKESGDAKKVGDLTYRIEMARNNIDPSISGAVGKTIRQVLGLGGNVADVATAPLRAPFEMVNAELQRDLFGKSKEDVAKLRRKATGTTLKAGSTLSTILGGGVGGILGRGLVGGLSGQLAGAGFDHESGDNSLTGSLASPSAALGALTGTLAGGAPGLLKKAGQKILTKPTAKLSGPEVRSLYHEASKTGGTVPKVLLDLQGPARRQAINQGITSTERVGRGALGQIIKPFEPKPIPWLDIYKYRPEVATSGKEAVQSLLARRSQDTMAAEARASAAELKGAQMQDMGISGKQVAERAVTGVKPSASIEAFKQGASEVDASNMSLQDLIAMSGTPKKPLVKPSRVISDVPSDSPALYHPRAVEQGRGQLVQGAPRRTQSISDPLVNTGFRPDDNMTLTSSGVTKAEDLTIGRILEPKRMVRLEATKALDNSPSKLTFDERTGRVILPVVPKKFKLEGNEYHMRGGKIVGAPEWVTNEREYNNLLKHIATYATKSAEETNGESLQWYDKYGNAHVKQLTAGDDEKARSLIGTLALTSPNADVAQNFDLSVRAMAHNEAGLPIRAGGFLSADTKIMEFLKGKNIDELSGPKVSDFNASLNGEKWRPVIDLWMMRLGGYSKDAPTAQQYEFMARAITAVAKNLGLKPAEVQAAAWVKLLHEDQVAKRGENAPSLMDVAKGYAVDQPMREGQVSWEAQPSTTAGWAPESHSAPYAVKEKYLYDFIDTLKDENGYLIPAREVGLLQPEILIVPGVYKGAISPGAQFIFHTPNKVGSREIDAAVEKQLEKFMATIGYFGVQDAVSAHRLQKVPASDPRPAVMTYIGRKLEDSEMFALAKRFEEVTGQSETVPVGTKYGANFINWKTFNEDKKGNPLLNPDGSLQTNTGVGDDTFYKIVKKVVQEVLPNAKIGRAGENSLYLESHDKEKGEPYGQGYRSRLSSGSPGLLRRLDSLLAARTEALIGRYQQEHGWTDARGWKFTDHLRKSTYPRFASLDVGDNATLTSTVNRSIIKQDPIVLPKGELRVKDIFGNTRIVKGRDPLVPYHTSDNKVLLQDGQKILVNKNQYLNLKNQSRVAEVKAFAPELKETEEVVRGVVSPKINDNLNRAISQRLELENEAKAYTDKGQDAPPDLIERWTAAKERENNLADTISKGTTTKYSQYTLPGGENYREVLIKAPFSTIDSAGKIMTYKKQADGLYSLLEDGKIRSVNVPEAMVNNSIYNAGWKQSSFKSSHWDEPNVLAHIRVNDRVTPDGKKVTFVEELQSDWAREARKNPSKATTLPDNYKIVERPNKYVVLNEFGDNMGSGQTRDIAIRNALTRLNMGSGDGEVPSHPLLKNWTELAAKRALIDAVNRDADYLSWTTGEQQAERYNLAKHLDEVKWSRITDASTKEQTGRFIEMHQIDGKGIIAFSVDNNGKIYRFNTTNATSFQDKQIDEVIGKGLAEKIMAEPKGTLSGEGLKFGGEWAANLYNKQLPKILEKLTGQKVETISVYRPEVKDVGGVYQIFIGDKAYGLYDTERKALAEAKNINISNLPQQQAIRLTPEVKALVREEPLPDVVIKGKVKGMEDNPAYMADLAQRFSESVAPFVDKYGLSPYTAGDYKDMRIGLSFDATTGYAVKPDGDLISVHSRVKGNGARAVIDAVVNAGASKLDCFDTGLKEYYERFGFEETGRDQWNPEYAPKNWDYQKFGTPDIVYMTLNREKFDAFIAKLDETGFRRVSFERNIRTDGSGDPSVAGRDGRGEGRGSAPQHRGELSKILTNATFTDRQSSLGRPLSSYLKVPQRVVKYGGDGGGSAPPTMRDILNNSGRMRERQFVVSMAETKYFDPEIIEKARSFYEIAPNKETFQNGIRILVDDEAGLRQRLEAGTVDPDDFAAGIIYMIKAQNEGNKQGSWEMAAMINKNATKGGQAIQILSTIDRLDPQGVVLYASKRMEAGKKTSLGKNQLDTILKLAERAESLKGLDQDIAKADLFDYVESVTQTKKTNFSRLLDSYRYNNMLSGARTQQRNNFENALNTLFVKPAVDLLSEGPASLRQYRGTFVGMHKGIKEAVKVFRSGAPMMGNKEMAQRSMRLPLIMDWPSRSLSASDAFWRNTIVEMDLARGKGVDEAQKRADEMLYLTPVEGNIKGEGHLLNVVNRMSSAMTHLVNKVPAGKWFVPFVRVPINIMKASVQLSPVGYTTMAGHRDPKVQFAKATLGTIFTLIAAALASEGNLTAGAPKNKKEREAFYASGRKAWSMKIGDRWIPMRYFGPLAFTMGLAASAHEAGDNADMTAVEKALDVSLSGMKQLSDQSFLTGLNNYFGLIGGEADYNFESNLGFTVGQLIPFSGMQRNINLIIDPTYRKTDGFWESLSSNIVGLGVDREPYQDVLTGEPTPRDPVNAFLPYDVGRFSTTGEQFLADTMADTREGKVITAEREARKGQAAEYYDQVSGMEQKVANKYLNDKYKEGEIDKEIFDQVRRMMKAPRDLTEQERYYMYLKNPETKTSRILEDTEGMARKERLNYFNDLYKKGIISKGIFDILYAEGR
jgi:hypothetical protein